MTDGPGRATNLVFCRALARKPSGWTGRGVCSSLRAQSASPGGVAERLNAPVLKTGVLSRGPWVRIPPPPPKSSQHVVGMRTHGQTDKWVRRLCGAQLCGAKLDTGASATVVPSPRGTSVGPPTRAKSDTGASATVAPSPRGVSSAPAPRTIPPPPPKSSQHVVGMRTHGQTDKWVRQTHRLGPFHPLPLLYPAARLSDSRGFSHCGAHL
jgi:hypothetical protein